MSACRVRFCAAVLVAAGLCTTLKPFVPSAVFAQTPAPDAALRYRPAQRDVTYDIPKAGDIRKCVVKLERGKGSSGFTVFDPNGQILRRYVDTNGDRFIDQWRYFRLGIEVYRDIDANFDNKIDQSRWLNTGGSRWGIDKNQDGTLDAWKTLSAEEATRVAISAMVAGDTALFSTVLISADDIATIGLTEDYSAPLLRQVRDPAAALKAVMASTQSLTSESKWSRFDAAMPGVIPADEGKARQDLMVYEGAMAIVETGTQHGFVQIGEMVRVGHVWKLTQIPRPMAGNTIQVAMGGVLMRPALAVTPGVGGPELTPELAALIESLQKLNSTPPRPDAAPQELLVFLRKRRAIILQLIDQSRTVQERDTWQRQLINLLASVAQAGDRSGVTELAALEHSLRSQSPRSPLIPYAVYRRQLGTYGLNIRSGDLKEQTAAQEQWLASLEKFVQTFPKSEDAPDALLQLAVNHELSGSKDDAVSFFTQLAGNYTDTPQGKRAAGAMRRLQLTGKGMPLSGTDMAGRTVNAETYRGKLLLIVFWASWSGEFEDAVPALNGLYQQYRSQGFEVVGVNLDPQAAAAKPFLQQNKISWNSIFQPGVFDSPLAQQYGILTVPTMFLIGRDGKVIGNNLSLTEVKDALRKQLD